MSNGIPDEQFPQWWHDAKKEFAEHLDTEKGPGCSLGGMSMINWYWLVVEGCDRPHGDKCIAPECTEVVEMPVRWRDVSMEDGVEMWELGICPTHANELGMTPVR